MAHAEFNHLLFWFHVRRPSDAVEHRHGETMLGQSALSSPTNREQNKHTQRQMIHLSARLLWSLPPLLQLHHLLLSSHLLLLLLLLLAYICSSSRAINLSIDTTINVTCVPLLLLLLEQLLLSWLFLYEKTPKTLPLLLMIIYLHYSARNVCKQGKVLKLSC